jgi:DNA-binding IclR family transcriptional regulator
MSDAVQAKRILDALRRLTRPLARGSALSGAVITLDALAADVGRPASEIEPVLLRLEEQGLVFCAPSTGKVELVGITGRAELAGDAASESQAGGLDS